MADPSQRRIIEALADGKTRNVAAVALEAACSQHDIEAAVQNGVVRFPYARDSLVVITPKGLTIHFGSDDRSPYGFR